jgi:tetratricopeptide (TPR) repeat protein
MRGHLQYLLADGFDPETAELALRVGLQREDDADPEMLRLKLVLGRGGDPMQPLRKELQNHLQMPLPPLWDRGMKVIIHAIEDELSDPDGRQSSRYNWVQTQILHPTDERRCTLGHPVARQVEVLWDWAQKFDQQGQTSRAIELLERLLLLAPNHGSALVWLASLLRSQGLAEECLPLYERYLTQHHDDIEVRLRKGEVLLHMERYQDALDIFQGILRSNGLHPLAHLGAAQARSYAGADPCPHLDAALELNRDATLSVLRETFDYRILVKIPTEQVYPLQDLPTMLGVTQGEVLAFIKNFRLPLGEGDQSVGEKSLSNWVTIQNRYQLLPMGLHWLAPTPRQLPDFP